MAMLSSLNWVDYVILTIFCLSVLAGFARGLFKEIMSLVVLVAAFVVASLFASPLAAMLTNLNSVQNLSNSMGANAASTVSYGALGVCFALLFLATVIVGCFIGFLFGLIFKGGILGIGNRILGAVFGFCRGYLINLVLIFVVQLSPFNSHAAWQQSQLVGYFEPAAAWLGEFVSPTLSDFKEKFGKTLENVNSSLQQNASDHQSKQK